MRARITLTWLWVLMFMTLGTVTASACLRFKSQTLTDVTRADVALVGRILDYKLQHKDGQKVDSGIFTIEPILPLRGVWFSEQVIYWENSVFGVPTEWSGDQTVFIAANLIDPDFRRLRGGMLDQVGNEISLQLLQSPCAPAFIFKASSTRAVFASSLVLLNWVVAIIMVGFFLRFVRIQRKRRLEN